MRDRFGWFAGSRRGLSGFVVGLARLGVTADWGGGLIRRVGKRRPDAARWRGWGKIVLGAERNQVRAEQEDESRQQGEAAEPDAGGEWP